MQHEEQTSPLSPGFGTNTNGLGILIVAVVAVSLALFCWDIWKDGSKEAEHYRFPATTTGSSHSSHH